jgi:hypothetical protein
MEGEGRREGEWRGKEGEKGSEWKEGERGSESNTPEGAEKGGGGGRNSVLRALARRRAGSRPLRPLNIVAMTTPHPRTHAAEDDWTGRRRKGGEKRGKKMRSRGRKYGGTRHALHKRGGGRVGCPRPFGTPRVILSNQHKWVGVPWRARAVQKTEVDVAGEERVRDACVCVSHAMALFVPCVAPRAKPPHGGPSIGLKEP